MQPRRREKCSLAGRSFNRLPVFVIRVRQGKPAVSKQELDNLSGGPKEMHTVTFRVTSMSFKKVDHGFNLWPNGCSPCWMQPARTSYIFVQPFVCSASVLRSIVSFFLPLSSVDGQTDKQGAT